MLNGLAGGARDFHADMCVGAFWDDENVDLTDRHASRLSVSLEGSESQSSCRCQNNFVG